MQHVSSYHPLSASERQPAKDQGGPSINGATQADVNWLWAELAELFGNTLIREYGEKPPEGWRRCLGDLSRQHLEYGLHQIEREGKDWPPSAPGFRKRCFPSPEDMGLPSEDEAYQQAAKRDWRHPEVYAAAAVVGTWELGSRPERDTRPVFIRAYRKVLQRRAMGHVYEFPRQRTAIPHKPKVDGPTDPAAAMAEMRQALGQGREEAEESA